MKKLIVGSVITCSVLFGGIVVPEMSMINSCQDRDVISSLEPEADVKLIKNWFEKASNADEANNRSLMTNLTMPRTTYEIKKHITYLKHSVKSDECIQEVAGIENTFDFWVDEMREKLTKPLLVVEEKPLPKYSKSESIDVDPIKVVTVAKKYVAPSKKYVKPSTIESYSSYKSNPSKLYIVSASIGVNVRSNPLLGKRSEIIDSIPYGTGLIWQEDVQVGAKEKWGQFVYRKNGSKHIGWIHMSYVRQSK